MLDRKSKQFWKKIYLLVGVNIWGWMEKYPQFTDEYDILNWKMTRLKK